MVHKNTIYILTNKGIKSFYQNVCMKGLAPHTLQVFEAVSKLDCIKSYLLVGGTALSLQMGTRQSEDLDFMKWRTSKTEKMEVAWYQIEKQ